MATATQKISSGYKQTEIGVIPTDWDVKELGKICKYQNGTSLERYFNQHDGYRVISIGNYSTSGNYIDTSSYISFDLRGQINKFILNKDDLTMILNDKTSTGEIIGRVLLIEKSNSYVFNQRTMRLISDSDVLPKYLYFLINSSAVHKKLARQAKPGTQIYFNTADILDFKVSFPKEKVEQSTIIDTLSDADILIKKLEKLIEKKKNIKQGAMQELLTGKRRLAGFSGKWEVKKLGEIAQTTKGQGLSKGKLSFSGKYPCILYGELFTTYLEIIKNVYSKTDFKEGVLSKKGDILIPGSTTTTGIDLAKASALLFDNILLGGDINIIRKLRNVYDSIFLAYCLTHIYKNDIAQKTKGITIHHLQGKDLLDLEIVMPEEPEQVAIANVLSDMDTEIEKLESQLTKYQNIKQGMMQTLLTGKIRLLTK